MRLDFRRGSSGGIARSSWGFFARLGPGAVISSAMANLAASMPESAKIPAVRLRLQTVRFAFKLELAIVLVDNYGEAVTIEVIVLEANEAVVFEV